ncbi:MAG: rhodanese-like domain-containing protein [Candidatus Sumerlaeaceae bacterium]|nr:rhodanese-like domain-containing protein [Candidatus Sumerlaeaceae bacterium]
MATLLGALRRIKRFAKRALEGPPPPPPPPRTVFGDGGANDPPPPAIGQPEADDLLEITVEEVKAALGREDIILLDVREPLELFHAGKIPGAVAIPMSELDSRLAELQAFRAREIFCYCAHGVRSLAVASFLSSRGYRARSMSGGYAVWDGPREAVTPS